MENKNNRFIQHIHHITGKIFRHNAHDKSTHLTQNETVGNLNNNESSTPQHSRTTTDEHMYETIIDGHPSRVERQPLHSLADGYLVIANVDD